MPSGNPRASAIVAIIIEFEQSVAAAETALVARDWPRVDALLSDQSRFTHALANALEETKNERPQAFTDEVFRRLDGITERRADQLRRLIAFNYLVTGRLTMISKSRRMRPSGPDRTPPPRILNSFQ